MIRAILPLLTGIIVATAAQASPAAHPSGIPRLERHVFRSLEGQETVAELGRLAVPADRTTPDGRTVEIAFVRLPNQAGVSGPPIVFLAGGPGIPGIGLAQVPIYAALFRRLQLHADIILLDQRGTGLARPLLRCEPRRLPPEAWRSENLWLEAFTAEMARCSAEFRSAGHQPGDFDPEESAADLEALRHGLGVEQLNLLAWSYGTEVALVALRAYPQSFGRVVLAGVRPPGALLKLPTQWDRQLRLLAHIAARDPAASVLTPDLHAAYASALRALSSRPVSLTVHDAATGNEVRYHVSDFLLQFIVRTDLSDLRNAARLPALLHGIETSEYELLRRRVEQLHNGFSPSPTLAVDCASGWTERRRRRARTAARSSLFGSVNVQWSSSVCAATGVRPLGGHYRRPVRSRARVLLISGTLDPNTPPDQAEDVRRGLPLATHVVFENAGHEMLPIPEAQDLIVRAFAGDQQSNARIVVAPPRFLSVDEALRPPRRPGG